jgi:excisionase family DNA binding protein
MNPGNDIIMVKLPKSGGMGQPVEWMRVVEAAKLCGVSTKTVKRWVAARKVTFRKIGARHLRIEVASLLAQIQSRDECPPSS